MRHLALYAILGLIALAGCAPGGVGSYGNGVTTSADIAGNTTLLTPGSTGYTNPHGIQYSVSGETRVAEALKQGDPSLKTPVAQPGRPSPPVLRFRLKEFTIERFDAAGADAPTKRYGKARARFQIFFEDQDPVTFEGSLTAQGQFFHFAQTSGRYTLSGDIQDLPATNEAKGDFRLSDSQTQGSARIFYNAYKAKIDVTTSVQPGSQPTSGSRAAKSVALLNNKNNFLWVHNWAVLGGPSTYLIDIVKFHPGPPDQAPHKVAIAFGGSSLKINDDPETDDDYSAKIVSPAQSDGERADSDNENPCDKIKMLGNSSETSARTFSCEVEDPVTKTQSEFVFDVDSVNAKLPFIADSEGKDLGSNDKSESGATANTPDLTTPVPEDTSEAAANPPSADSVAQPPQVQPPVSSAPEPQKPVNKQPPVPASNSYLPVYNTPGAQGLIRDFAQNRRVKSVVDALQTFRGSGRKTVTDFLYYSAPFRAMLDGIDKLRDVTWVYALIPTNEGGYFKEKYFDQHFRTYHPPYWNLDWGDKGVSRGPFQFQFETGRENGLITTANGDLGTDERLYFAPAACAAAVLFAKDEAQFNDKTLAIMSHNTGHTGALGIAGAPMARGALKLGKTYGYTFAHLVAQGGVQEVIETYVARILALHFITMNPSEFGFDAHPKVAFDLSSIDTVMPPKAISEPNCRALMQSLNIKR